MVETKTRLIIRRLAREGWVNAGGSSHDKFEHPDKPGVVISWCHAIESYHPAWRVA